ncbi:endonuclease MutS2 [Borreliella yangtzensis]|uniref:Endonuclease MutS2 n=1 Tax=Borreliella yangtzensis TaxID=683292 RepID=A0ABR6PA32_9SPIR|nr:endonuclease MutS2 [Borreliella yangtzensis]MBB6043144.1 DNA mismatch repair protein MutS2 [Borreliella yangtzensis]WKC73093.1 endonuclease MutS2 [Borreliella yangtzensis]WKC74010.1 endonuclease MutS2 [Borreliella yangtzensis]
MQDKYLKNIDFYEILSLVSEYVSNPDTVNLLNKQKILKTRESLEKMFSFVSLIRMLFESCKGYPNSFINSLEYSISLLSKENSRASIEDLRDIVKFLDEVLKINLFLHKNSDIKHLNTQILFDLLFLSPELKNLLSELKKYVDFDALELKNGVVKEYDSVEFEIKNLNRRIEKQIKKIINLNIEYLASNFVYYKSNKYTLALKSNFKGKIKGNIISVSSSGETFYIEPNDVVNDNNKLNYLNLEKERIILKILQNLSDKVRTNIVLLDNLYNNFLYYDSLKVRAIYGIKTKGIFPKISNVLNIFDAYHPLLKAPKAITFTSFENRVVIITGPNAGGKTVTLKTVGLLSAMFQFGIPIVVGESSTFKIFDNIFIDIGDEQSIYNSLSTFSSHMSNISYILKHTTKNSLVIFDEFCSGTDIDQGQALAISILEYLIDINSYVLISTHYNALKYFAYTHEGVVNASMCMNLETMQPNYNLIFSIPGESYAFNVASKVLIDSSIVIRANEIYLSQKTEVNKILERLIEKEKDLLLTKESMDKKLIQIELQEKEIKNIYQNLLLKEKNIEIKLLNEQNEFLKNSRKVLENLVREIKEGNIDVSKNKAFISDLEKNVDLKLNKVNSLNNKRNIVRDFKIGDRVRIVNSNAKGRIVGMSKKKIIVNVGTFNVSVSSSEISLEKVIEHKKEGGKNFSFSIDYNKEILLSFTVDIRGMRVVDALDFLNKKIDNIILNDINKFEIIHGKGEGHLMREVHKLLKELKFVKKYYFAHPSDGGAGKTIVEI